MKFIILKKRGVIVAVSLILALLIASAVVIPVSSVQTFNRQKRLLPIYSVKTDKQQIAISFDCAWGTDYTDKLLEIMQNNEVKCTFFAVEFWTKKHPDCVEKIYKAGHEIGTHSATHPHMAKLNSSAIEKELSTSKKAIEDITGEPVKLFRPPYGEYNDLVISKASELGLYTIQWDVDSLDWKDLSASEIEGSVTSKVKNGSIVLFHNQGKHTASALDNIIKKLKGKGYEFVKISDLIYKENYHILPDGTQVENK